MRTLFDAESVGIADSTPTPTGSGEQECFAELQTTRGVAFSTNAGVSAYVDLEKFAGGASAAIAPLREVLSNGLVEKTVHDVKRAVGLLDHFDITLEGVRHDTYLAAYLLDPTRTKYDLADLAKDALNLENGHKPPPNWSDGLANRSRRGSDRADRERAVRTHPRKETRNDLFGSGTMLYRMERAGLKVDKKVLADLSSYIGQNYKLTIRIYELAGREFNIGSPKQVGEVLSDLHIDIGRKTSTGRISTSKAVLEELAQQFELRV